MAAYVRPDCFGLDYSAVHTPKGTQSSLCGYRPPYALSSKLGTPQESYIRARLSSNR